MTIEADIVDCIDAGNTLGEGVVWRGSDQTVWWTDIQDSRLFRMSWPARQVQAFALPERLGSFGLVADDDAWLVCAFETGFALFQPETAEIRWLSRPPELQTPGVRLNDGKVGPDGCFWAGSMHEGAGERPCETGFYRLGSGAEARLAIPGLGIPNGLAWSPSGNAMYYSDTLAGTVYRCDAPGGAIAPETASAYTKPETGGPDGATVDSEGRYWTALWGASRLAVYSAEGAPLAEIALPALQPTCLAFGGPDMDLVFVTSAREGLDAGALEASPQSGHLFVLRTNARGLPGNRFIP